jgi:hypothetical protein
MATARLLKLTVVLGFHDAELKVGKKAIVENDSRDFGEILFGHTGKWRAA